MIKVSNTLLIYYMKLCTHCIIGTIINHHAVTVKSLHIGRYIYYIVNGSILIWYGHYCYRVTFPKSAIVIILCIMVIGFRSLLRISPDLQNVTDIIIPTCNNGLNRGRWCAP